jgi:hypothetical protein
MNTGSNTDCQPGTVLTGKAATARFIELLTGLQSATMQWRVSKGINFEEYFYAVSGTHEAVSRRLQKDQQEGRNIGMSIRSYRECGKLQSLGAVYLEFADEYSGYMDFLLQPDFIVCAGKASWTAYWLTASTDRSEINKLRYALSQHYEQETTRMPYAQPVPGFTWHEGGSAEEVTLIDFTGKHLGDYSHWEGLHTLEELHSGLKKNSKLIYRVDDPGWSQDRNFDPLADDKAPATSESYFPCYLDGEKSFAPTSSDLITNFLPDDALYMIYGATGSLKTFVMLDVVYSAASGKQLWSSPEDKAFSPRDRLKAVFLVGEGQAEFQNRVEAWKRHHGITQPLDVLNITAMPRFDSQSQLKWLIRTISNKLGYADVLVVDTLMEASAGFNISDPSNARDFILACKYLRRHLLCTVCLIHHTGKDHKGHLGAEHLKAAVDVVDKVEAKTAAHTTTVRIAQEKNRDRAKRHDVLLEATPVKIGLDESGTPITSLVLKRKSGQDASPGPDDDLLKTALDVLDNAKGGSSLSIQDLVEQVIDSASPALAGDARAKEAARLRRAISDLAKNGGLRPYAKRGGRGRTSPWLFKVSSSPNAIAAE